MYYERLNRILNDKNNNNNELIFISKLFRTAFSRRNNEIIKYRLLIFKISSINY